MSTNISVYLGNQLFNWLKGTTFAAAPGTVAVSLWNGDPDSGGTEVTGTVGLTRQAVSFGAISARAMSSSADITFGTASGSATVTFVGLYDSATAGAGNELSKVSITSTAISNGLVVKILSGNLTLSY